MASLTGVSVASSYTSLLKLNGNTDTLVAGASGAGIQVVDGDGTGSPLYLNTDRLGVGVAPSHELTVNNQIGIKRDGTDAFGTLTFDSSGLVLDQSASGYSPLKIKSNGSEIARFTSTGLGIGISSPTALLSVQKASSSDTDFTNSNNPEAHHGILLNNNRFEAGSFTAITMNTANASSVNGVSIISQSASSGHAGKMIFARRALSGTTESMRIDSSGNVGVGHDLSSHTQKLVVKNNASATTLTAGAMLNLVNEQGAGNTASIRFSGSQQNAFLGFFDGSSTATQRIAIGVGSGGTGDGHLNVTANGTVGVGSTNPQSSLVVSSGNNTGIEFSPDHSNTRVNMFVIDRTASLYENLRIDAETTTFRTTSDSATLNTAMVLEGDGTTNQQGQYTVNEQGRQNHVCNTMASPYYRFDGTDDSINIGTPVAGLNNFSLVAWAKAPDWDDNNHHNIICSYSTGDNSDWYRMSILNDGTITFSVDSGFDDGDLVQAKYTHSLVDDTWHHIVGVCDQANNLLTLYVDGVSVATTTYNDNTALNPTNLRIGSRGDSNSAENWIGEISNAQVWNKSLTATEVKDLYSGASVPFKYKGANQTNLFDADASTFEGSGTHSWTAYGSNNIANTSNQLVITYVDNASGAFLYLRDSNTLSSDLAIGKKYRLSVDAKYAGGSAGVTLGINDGTNNFASVALTTSMTRISIEWTSLTTTSNFLRLLGMGASNVVTLDNFELVPIGTVAEYDGSSAGEKVWGDKSGNSLDGTVSGATVENAPYDANTEYEEGTFDPAWVAGTGSFSGTISYQNRVGKYVKIGNAVHITIGFYNNEFASTGGSGSIKIGGLPYTASAKCALALGDTRLFNDDNPSEAEVGNGTTNVILYIRDGNADVANSELQVTDLATGSGIVGNLVTLSGTYFT